MKSKDKVQKIRQHRNRTGGGSPSRIVLTEFDERILAIVGEFVADGDPALEEIGFNSGKLNMNKFRISVNSLV